MYCLVPVPQKFWKFSKNGWIKQAQLCIYNCDQKLPELNVVHVEGSFNNQSKHTNGVRIDVIFLGIVAKTCFNKVHAASLNCSKFTA